MKMIITCRRKPTHSREGFFDYLRNSHWPLVQRYPTVVAALSGGYIQNHALGDVAPAGFAAPFDIAADRDSVIELFFDGPDGLTRLVETPDYVTYVRPDENNLADRPANIMVRTLSETIFEAPQPGRCKRFDFIARKPGAPAEQFLTALAEDGRRLALDPFYTGHVDRHVHNIPAYSGDGLGFGAGEFDCVREVWGGGFEALSRTASLYGEIDADRTKSFSVFATEFVMLRPAC